MIAAKVNVTEIDKDEIFTGKKGKYLDLLLIYKPDLFGNTGMVVQGVSKESREKGKQGKVIGSWKELKKKEAA